MACSKKIYDQMISNMSENLEEHKEIRKKVMPMWQNDLARQKLSVERQRQMMINLHSVEDDDLDENYGINLRTNWSRHEQVDILTAFHVCRIASNENVRHCQKISTLIELLESYGWIQKNETKLYSRLIVRENAP